MAKRLGKRALCGAEALDVSLLEEIYREGPLSRMCRTPAYAHERL